MDISANNVKLSKEEKKLAKELKKAETMKKFLNKPKLIVKTDKKVNIKIAEEVKLEKTTPIGCKKDISNDLPKSYCPIYTEEGWFNWWESQGYFKPEYNENKSSEKFVMMIPPPNVTGVLHIGHALTCSIEDCIVRWNRMHGKQTLWLPGTDHAGIATQTVVEKKLLRERNLTRHDLGREAFVDEIWKWKTEKGDLIMNQLKQIGSSCDFSRLRFTMDESMSKAVTETFVRLFNDGLIYRSKRLVNWSCSLRSAISDIEVDKIEITKRTYLSVPNYDKPIEFGVLVHFAYEVADETKERIIVATTRLETMLGDSAVAVHPDDERYTHLHGKFVRHPFAPTRIIPIICDTFVDRNFGTGAVKITPAHDHNDYEVGKRHNLDFINILTDDGLIVHGYDQFSGMKRFDARRHIATRLTELGLYERTTDNPMSIPVCSKSKDIIEALIKNQWYLRCGEMATEALRVVETGELRLLPEGVHNTVWRRWMEDCHDWCISRQLWWGHRIPVYRITVANRPIAHDDEHDCWIAARSHAEALQLAAERFQAPPTDITASQDPDVLDTWFSSQLFPFATLGWPDVTSEDLSRFYPGNLLETGHDIIFFWVARMVMIGLKLMGRLPFDTVYLHAMIRDAHGRKMSKSLGNVLDPLDVIRGVSLAQLQLALEHGNLDPAELVRARAGQSKDFPGGIPQCGTDALRFALLAYTAQPRDINLDVLRVKGYRNFCNKIWQAFRYCQQFGVGDATVVALDTAFVGRLAAVDRWILSRLAFAVVEIDEAFRAHNFAAVTTIVYRFWLYELCDVYIEYTKRFRSTARQPVIVRVVYECLEVGLRLLHPAMPFITEELFQRLPKRHAGVGGEDSIMVSAYPKPEDYRGFRDVEVEEGVEKAMEMTRRIRSYRKDAGMGDKQVLAVRCRVKDEGFCETFLEDIILPLSNCVLSESTEGSVVIVENFSMEIRTVTEDVHRGSECDWFTVKITEEDKQREIGKLKQFENMDKLGELDRVFVKQWCNWIVAQAVRGKAALKETLEYVNEHLLKNTFVSGRKYPTMADSLMMNYLVENKVNDGFLEKFANIKRWNSTVNNYQ